MGCGVSNPDRVAQLIQRDPAGNDVIVLDLLGPHAGGQGIELGEDVENLYHVPGSSRTESGAYQEGADVGLPRIDARVANVNLIVRGRSQTAFEQIDTLLWRVLSLHRDAVYRQYDSIGRWRETTVRLNSTPKGSSSTIIGKRTHFVWPVELLSGDPFWYSAPIKVTFTRADMTEVSPGVFEKTVEWSNPANWPCYPQFRSGTITGDEKWTFPDGDSGVTHPVRVTAANGSFIVNTYPTDPTVLTRDGGNGAWAKMRAEAFDHPLAASTPIPRTVTIRLEGGTAASSMQVYLPQRWLQPIGGWAS
ncbi:MAG: hypothetical protein QM658_09640 [Gordonia sp. (in: high G+C Gram-positive bacteria)]